MVKKQKIICLSSPSPVACPVCGTKNEESGFKIDYLPVYLCSCGNLYFEPNFIERYDKRLKQINDYCDGKIEVEV